MTRCIPFTRMHLPNNSHPSTGYDCSPSRTLKFCGKKKGRRHPLFLSIWIEPKPIRIGQTATKVTKEESRIKILHCEVDPIVCFHVFSPFVTFVPLCSIPRPEAGDTEE